MRRIEQLIELLNLQKHPEGGYFKETYRSEGVIPSEVLKDGIDGDRNYCTGIYFLLTSDNFSAFHRIKQDEMCHYYEGSPLTVHMIDKEGNYSFQKVGLHLESDEVPQFVVPKGVWFASEVQEPDSYSLVGCTVSPGFDFKDFELAEKDSLISEFPKHSEIIGRLSR
ncbi:MAG: cupin domain-containing protein [Balneola sp.]|nr:cupin domain-containing protein [Balneola sp.]MBO6651276.1 cupin domain-containing protein [Balneola sp.]MBO6710857.1 cupin domain-containing protein [Balneola sp.]MBO6799544.1 cupin domain-containing protein [Balneola sp.]MBO6870276.1 cupin domain-containing protein [Balneola sp.]